MSTHSLHVAWISDTERVEAFDAASALLVLPDESDGSAHRLYWSAQDVETLAKMLAVVLDVALASGAWPLACKIYRDNPGTHDQRGTPFPAAPDLPAWRVSPVARAAIESLISACVARARSTDGSHLAHMHSALAAVLEHVRVMETAARLFADAYAADPSRFDSRSPDAPDTDSPTRGG